MELVLEKFSSGQIRTVEQVVAAVTNETALVSEGEVRSALLTLLRRNELQLTDQFTIQQADTVIAA